VALLDRIMPRWVSAAVATAVGVAALAVAIPAPASAQEPAPGPFGPEGLPGVEGLSPDARGRRPTPELTSGNVLLRNGRFTPLPDAPGAQATVHRGLNDRGQTAGAYIDDGAELGADGLYPPDAVHGFVYTPSHNRNRRFETIDIPGARYVVPYDINNRGQIVGLYLDEGAVPGPDGLPPPGAQHAFLWDRGEVTVVDPPDTVLAPNAYSVNDRGQIVGERIVAGVGQLGFVRQPDGRFVTLDPPGGAENKALGINDRGQVVGAYLDDGAVPGPDGLFAADTIHGYMWDDGRYTRLDVPGARATAADDINNRGQIVGDVKDAAGRIRGFLRTRGSDTLIDGPGDRSDSIAIHTNDRGDILIPAPGTIDAITSSVA